VAGAGTERISALLALAIPVLAGLAYMAAFGAPSHYLLINGAVLLAGLALIAFGGPVVAPLLHWRRLALVALLALYALPLLTGPELSGIARWLPLPGGLALHAGMLVLPLVAVLAAEDADDAPVALLAALLVALLQSDGASAAAVSLTAVGLARAWNDWRQALVAAIGLLVTVIATLRGELPPQPFVERVVVDAVLAQPVAGLLLLAAQLVGFVLIAYALAQPRALRLALGGTLFGFVVLALINVYPTPLMGFGAAPILGFALALAVRRRPGA